MGWNACKATVRGWPGLGLRTYVRTCTHTRTHIHIHTHRVAKRQRGRRVAPSPAQPKSKLVEVQVRFCLVLLSWLQQIGWKTWWTSCSPESAPAANAFPPRPSPSAANGTEASDGSPSGKRVTVKQPACQQTISDATHPHPHTQTGKETGRQGGGTADEVEARGGAGAVPPFAAVVAAKTHATVRHRTSIRRRLLPSPA